MPVAACWQHIVLWFGLPSSIPFSWWPFSHTCPLRHPATSFHLEMAFSTSVLSALPSPTLDPNTTPALKAPPGLSSNLHDPPTRQGATIVAIVLFMVTTTPAVVARMVTRTVVHRSVQWDDCKPDVLSTSARYRFVTCK
ncbi:hypothetical protein GQ44DRAFT_201302 [Phaeosphaeriaceae sp. PMI808]|nr:hypothetical protein GQ44DRAFT_201302 [Phaeosphaeriaceae sp. PMI808]